MLSEIPRGKIRNFVLRHADRCSQHEPEKVFESIRYVFLLHFLRTAARKGPLLPYKLCLSSYRQTDRPVGRSLPVCLFALRLRLRFAEEQNRKRDRQAA